MTNIARIFKSWPIQTGIRRHPSGTPPQAPPSARAAGNIATMAALMSVPVIGAAGLSVDGIRVYMLHDRMMSALDAAALAGGRVLSTANVEADVRMYFDANIPADYLGATVGTPKVTVGANDETLTLSASATLPTTFARVLGVDTIPVTVTNRIRRTVRGMELALVLDVTGSMWWKQQDRPAPCFGHRSGQHPVRPQRAVADAMDLAGALIPPPSTSARHARTG